MSGSHDNLYFEIHQNPACVDEIVNSNNNNDLMALVCLLPRLPKALEIAQKVLKAKSASVRIAMVGYLHRIAPSYELVWSLANDEDSNVRWAVSKVVSEIPFGAEIADHMVSNDTCEHCRWSIAKQLDKLPNGEALALKLIEDPEIFVREQVFKELHKLSNGLELAKRAVQGDVQHDRLMLASNVNTFENPDELDSMLRKHSDGGIRRALNDQRAIRERLAAGLPATGGMTRFASPYDVPAPKQTGRIRYSMHRRAKNPMSRSSPLR